MNDYAYVSMDGSGEDLHSLISSPILAFDVEATGVNVGTAIPYGFSLANMPNAGYYCDIGNDFFRQLLADKNRLYVAHNARYDRSEMKKAGVVIDNLCDPMIAAHLLEKERLALKYLILEYFGVEIMAYTDLPKPLSEMTTYEKARYSAPHSFMALLLWRKLDEEMKRYNLRKVFWNIEMPLVPVISDMELNGIKVDVNVLKRLGEEFDRKIAVLAEAMDYHSGYKGINYNSPAQVSDILYNKLGIPPVRSTKKHGSPSVDARYLEPIKGQHPFISVYLAFKHLKTLKHSYVNSLIRNMIDGRIYASFNQTRTRTSRLSSSGPNLQKIPVRTPDGRLIRTAFVAPEGHSLIKADWDQLELKMLAHCSKDPHLIEAFLAGRDIHEETAIRVYRSKDRRRDGKTLNYKIIFGGGGISVRGMFFKAYPQAAKWISDTIKEAQESFYAITLGGRRRHIHEFWSISDRQISHGGRETISTIVQGSSAEEVKKGMVRVWKRLRDTCAKMTLQVHDELVFEVPDRDVPDVIQVIKETLPTNELDVPLTVTISVGKNWGEMEKVEKN